MAVRLEKVGDSKSVFMVERNGQCEEFNTNRRELPRMDTKFRHSRHLRTFFSIRVSKTISRNDFTQ